MSSRISGHSSIRSKQLALWFRTQSLEPGCQIIMSNWACVSSLDPETGGSQGGRPQRTGVGQGQRMGSYSGSLHCSPKLPQGLRNFFRLGPWGHPSWGRAHPQRAGTVMDSRVLCVTQRPLLPSAWRPPGRQRVLLCAANSPVRKEPGCVGLCG